MWANERAEVLNFKRNSNFSVETSSSEMYWVAFHIWNVFKQFKIDFNYISRFDSFELYTYATSNSKPIQQKIDFKDLNWREKNFKTTIRNLLWGALKCFHLFSSINHQLHLLQNLNLFSSLWSGWWCEMSTGERQKGYKIFFVLINKFTHLVQLASI
jgi:hypothetical protein